MQAEEAAAFEQNPYFGLIIQMRRWDEAAKVTVLPNTYPGVFYFSVPPQA
jgi:predicted HD phosphohydrolase